MRWWFDGRRRRSPHVSGRYASDERAASEVVGTILLVAITVLMAGGFAVLLGNFSKPIDKAHADISLSLSSGSTNADWGTGDEEVIVSHLGGEGIEASTTTVVVTIAGTRQELSGSGLIAAGGGFSDGRLTIGETWSPAPTNIAEDDSVDILMTTSSGGSSIIAANTINPSSTPVVVATYTYPDSWSFGHGTSPDPVESLEDDDGGVTATLTEALTPSAGTLVRTASIPTGTGGATANALTLNDQHAVLDANTETVRVNSWSPTCIGTVSQVTAKIDAKHVGTRTDDVLRFKYYRSTTFDSQITVTTTGTDAVTSRVLPVPAGGWTCTNVNAIQLEADYLSNPPKDSGLAFHVDAMWVEVAYSGTFYSADAELQFVNVPAGTTHAVEAEYSTNLDSFRIQVLTLPSTWSNCGPVLSSGAATTWTGCALNPTEYNAGSPRLRIVDQTDSPTQQGTITMDYVRIGTTT